VRASSSLTATPIGERWLEWLWPLQPAATASPSRDATKWERGGRILLLALLLVGLPIALNRAVTHGVSDFRGFYEASRNVLDYGVRLENTTFAYYWPSLDVAFVAFAWLPMPIAGALWYLLGCASWIGLLRSANYYLLDDFDDRTRRVVTLLAGLLVTPLAVDGLCLGAFHTFMVWWMVAGLGRVSRGRNWSGGALLGLAVWIKLLPLVGVAYLVWKRRWKAAAIAVGCALALDIALSIAGYGLEMAWQEHVRWWQEQGADTAQRQLSSNSPVSEDRLTNQSLVVILRRTLTPMGASQGGPRVHATLLHLSQGQLKAVYLSVVALLGLGIATICRRPAWRTPPSAWSTEIALMSLATLWFSPVMWGYHPTAATPALMLVLARTIRRPMLLAVTILVWITAMCLLGWPLACTFGEMFWTTILLGGMLLGTSGRSAWGKKNLSLHRG
jgi:hypothetical protein